MKYLKKFETQAAYEAAESGLILPNVSLTVDNNTVHYNPSTPTPSLSVVAVLDCNEDEVELPYYDGSSNGCWNIYIKFSRPITYDELSGLTIEVAYGESSDVKVCNAYLDLESDVCRWIVFDEYETALFELDCDRFEGTTDTIQLVHGDFNLTYHSFYF